MQQRLIIEVCQGRLKGHKTALVPGETLRVGRTDRADFVIRKDRKLSGIHFELSWDGSTCKLRDRNSKEGTLLGGEPVTEAEVEHGGWIRAGQTDFSVYYEAHTPPRPIDEDDPSYRPDPSELPEARQRALDALRNEAQASRLYAVLDAARSPRILELLRESVEAYQSLYEGVGGEKLAHVAPYLVQLPPGSRLLEVLVTEGWGRRWGIYLTSKRAFNEVRRHLRRFLIVQIEGPSKTAYFRYYDPFTLGMFFDNCTPQQLSTFSSLTTHFMFEHTKSYELVRSPRSHG